MTGRGEKSYCPTRGLFIIIGVRKNYLVVVVGFFNLFWCCFVLFGFFYKNNNKILWLGWYGRLYQGSSTEPGEALVFLFGIILSGAFMAHLTSHHLLVP